MSSRFIGKGNGLVLTCNHGDLALGVAPIMEDGKPVLHKNGTPATEHVFPRGCAEKLTTGQILRSGIRAYAKTQKWLTVEVSGRLRDFCAAHAPIRAEQIKNRKRDADAARAAQKAAREKAEADRRAARVARLAEWKRKRDEKAARSAAWHAKRAAKAA
jgi:hypothetical protein